MGLDVAVIGGGPAGLYFGYLLKRRDARARVRVFERNPPGATFGFGVVFSDRALEFLREDDEETHAFLDPHMESWPDLRIVHRDRPVAIDGNGFAAIGRLALLRLLHARCAAVGAEIVFEREVRPGRSWAEADLVVGADGVNSVVRGARARAFGAAVEERSNRFVWYGTTRVFDALSLTFRRAADGVFVAHHYRYSPEMSTFIVECDRATWDRAGFAAMTDAESRAYCQTVFAPELDGRPLVSNKSTWRRFPAVRNERWSAGKFVLLGDALRTCHFSIGSGTRLAMEDALALDRALAETGGDLPVALALFEAERRPPVEKIVAAAEISAAWYERMEETTAQTPEAFAYDYMTRTGRVSDDRLRRIAPRFMALRESGRGR